MNLYAQLLHRERRSKDPRLPEDLEEYLQWVREQRWSKLPVVSYEQWKQEKERKDEKV